MTEQKAPPQTLFDMPGGMMLNPDDSPNVLAYRLGEVEKKVDRVLDRFDQAASLFVTTASLMLILEPVKDRIKELETKDKDAEQTKNSQQVQFRLALTMAVLSPIFTMITGLIVYGR